MEFTPLDRATEEIRVVHNPENPERPMVEVKTLAEVEKDLESKGSAEGEYMDPKEAPVNVAERLGYRCASSGIYSSPREGFCPKCGGAKVAQVRADNPFGDLIGLVEVTM